MQPLINPIYLLCIVCALNKSATCNSSTVTLEQNATVHPCTVLIEFAFGLNLFVSSLNFGFCGGLDSYLTNCERCVDLTKLTSYVTQDV